MKIYIGADHAGYEMKEVLKKYLADLGHQVEDKGAFKYDPEDDYPDFVIPTAQAVANDPKNSRHSTPLGVQGIIIGGSGQGEAMCANRVRGVRSAVYYGGSLEIVELSRKHNNANILSLGARFIDDELAKKAVKLWLETGFDGGRHEQRIAKMDQ
ncbi:ribose-5-phosphate isomerase [Candidatus Giovannonibacteria bacterium RIFCSPLOWO2_01_FULL_44_40]|uniref:Ribose-5-phosphate isomerase n=1 Tax=Candidatus Giovannonibacteria bacterium RIFCSPHIGHO2_01_FULL_45_23 TaxID=1798325 RepID=A0A1F5VFG7_9BACT|nr:MAG: ribose-5-phosphate isomerase [Candidatus Giovannonibacteria bacterium RIFCSPHIGHO2_01_FULL_45_23]OGF75076.1 MAG: ribose-5-phosphate isomerase [Candidatus Giovannonibacteria bacterium RIFCSPHIGHO2_02_FULL_45_13]OGF80189.1 MAG: ribose-5-phosphate isomerase [Candidatus Giovannonibacteria bacterium RIFCSPLOWO2_01_FULL_44_40]